MAAFTDFRPSWVAVQAPAIVGQGDEETAGHA